MASKPKVSVDKTSGPVADGQVADGQAGGNVAGTHIGQVSGGFINNGPVSGGNVNNGSQSAGNDFNINGRPTGSDLNNDGPRSIGRTATEVLNAVKALADIVKAFADRGWGSCTIAFIVVTMIIKAAGF